MTQKQIDAARKSLHEIEMVRWTDEQRRLFSELSCRDMINSCLCYGGISVFWEHHPWCIPDVTYADSFIRELGEERVKEIAAEQEADFAKATVLYDVANDFEGNYYNSIVWADEIRMV